MSLGQNSIVYISTTTSAATTPEITGMTGSVQQTLLLNSSPLDKKNGTLKRCGVCSKKVGLTGFQCRCGTLYCGLHRYPDEHSCTFDYLSEDKKILEKKLIIGKLSEKMEKI
ncbi:hypothetical protein EB118_18830 [bacterium]|nr:hypothetical protein [Actinomycetota bacterium]NDG32116.1 hypothetical protein [bacterium]